MMVRKSWGFERLFKQIWAVAGESQEEQGCLELLRKVELAGKKVGLRGIIIIIMIITRFQSEDQVCISTTLRDLDISVLTQTCRCESQSRLSN